MKAPVLVMLTVGALSMLGSGLRAQEDPQVQEQELQEAPPALAEAVRADVGRRGLPDLESAPAEGLAIKMVDGLPRGPDGAALLLVRFPPEHAATVDGMRCVGFVDQDGRRYWLLARRRDPPASVQNGPFALPESESVEPPVEPEPPTEPEPAPEPPVAPEPAPELEYAPATPETMARIVEGLVARSARARAAAVEEFFSLGPAGWDALGPALEGRSEAEAARVRDRLQERTRARVSSFLEQQDSGFYEGQYRSLARYGRPGLEALWRCVKQARGGASTRIAARALQALGELGGEADRKELRSLLDEGKLGAGLETAAIYALAHLGDREPAEKLLERARKAVEESPDDAGASEGLAQVYLQLGQREAAYQVYEEFLQREEISEGEAGLAHYNMACIQSMLGEVDRALEHLREAIQMGWTDYEWMDQDGDLSRVREDPRYAEIRRLAQQKAARRIY